MGAPPPGEFSSTTTMVIRGAAKHPKDLERFRAEVDRILSANDGQNGMLASRTVNQIRVTNQNPPGPCDDFDGRFKGMRDELEKAVKAFPNLQTFLSLIRTASTRSTKTRRKKAKARNGK